MRRFPALLALAILSVIPLIFGINCASVPVQTAGDLTVSEKAAAGAAIRSAGGFSQAAEFGQNAAETQRPTGSNLFGGLGLGTCPDVSTAATLGESGVSVTVDFADGCELSAISGYTCSGSASGQIVAASRSISLEFDQVSCSGETALSGEITATYEIAETSISLDGDWDLIWTTEEESVAVAGSGKTSYDTQSLVATVEAFSGMLTEDDTSWAFEADALLISYSANQSFIPYAGTVVLSGDSIRDITIRFDENSPSTGQVEVKIGNGPFFVMDINQF